MIGGFAVCTFHHAADQKISFIDHVSKFYHLLSGVDLGFYDLGGLRGHDVAGFVSGDNIRLWSFFAELNFHPAADPV